MVVLTGTGRKAQPHEPGDLIQRRIMEATVLEAGYGSGRHTNRSAGISFVFSEAHTSPVLTW